MIHSTQRASSKPERTSLSERAYFSIRERILKGQLPLGAAISRRTLASELGMSLLPVSEALQRLENDGLIESQPRIGTRVCMPNAVIIAERYQVREALESQAARLFTQKAGDRERSEIRNMAENMDAMFNQCFASENNSPEFLYAVHGYHAQFHLRIAECTGCGALRDAIEKNHVLIFNWLYDIAAHRPPLPQRHHRDLATALCEGGPDDADRAIRYHIRYGLEAVVQTLNHSSGSSMERVK